MPDLDRRGIGFPRPLPLIDGEVPACGPALATDERIVWPLDGGGTITVKIGRENDVMSLDVVAEGVSRPLDSIGLRFPGITGVRQYLRNGYQSWDGSYFVVPGTPPGDGPPAKAPTLGFAMTALLPAGDGAVMLGFDRHDRFQTRFRFGGTAEALAIDVETLLDRTGEARGESLFLFDGDGVEDTLRRWSARVAAASPLAPRVPPERLTGWCSWYSLYAAIDAKVIGERLVAAKAFRDTQGVPLDIFLIDDGFTPEMGDWLTVKPQFPDGMAPLLAEAEAAGFRPGLWIAPLLVGNRSNLCATHTDWLVQDVTTGGPLVAMEFYGEFRWHKRSEEYYVLDVTHPDAAAYLAQVIRTWVGEWGVRYIKADFLLHGAEYGPDRARWHQPGMSRIGIWRQMMEILREAAGAGIIISGCGCPLWASIGLVDAVRIGRDIGVTWNGDYSAESLLRDLQTRNHANGLLWQADPDCVLLRDHFHYLTNDQLELLARFAAGCGGVLMTSDDLAALPSDRAEFFAKLLSDATMGCDFPVLGLGHSLVQQHIRHTNGNTSIESFQLS